MRVLVYRSASSPQVIDETRMSKDGSGCEHRVVPGHTRCVAAFTVRAAATAQIRDIHVPRIASPPRLEQFLGGASRGDMKHIDDFRQRQPGDGVPVSRKTSAWIGFDDQNFYAVFVCASPAGQTRARMSKREDIMSDDIVGIFFDTYRSGQRGYEFFVNPLGVQADAALSESQGDDFSFDTLWYSEGKITPEGYVAMMTIPFRSLRFASQAVQTWGFGLYRGIPTNNENSFWPYVTEKISGFVPQLAKMTGLENISPGRNLQLIPYAAFSRSHFLDQPDPGVPAFRGKTDFRPGLDAKAVIHDTLTLDVALNPDFSQVESDDPQVTVNQRFEVVFPEKRPVLPREQRLFHDAGEPLLFAAHRGPRIRRTHHRKAGPLESRECWPSTTGRRARDSIRAIRITAGAPPSEWSACSVTSVNRMWACWSPIASSPAVTIASRLSTRGSNSTTHGHSPAR